MRSSKINYLIIVLFGAVICIGYYLFQSPNNFSVNPKADANEYLKIYNFFQGERTWDNIRFGIHNRMVIPLVASLLPWQTATFNFFVVNSIFAILSLISIYYLLELFNVRRIYIFLVLIFFSLHYVGPFRQNAAGPVNVDMAVYLFEALLLIFLIKRKYLILILLTPIAIATKELFLALIIVTFFTEIMWRIYFRDKLFSITAIGTMLVLGIITKLILNHYFPSASPGRNSIIVMAFHIRNMLICPDHIWKWILSLFAALGGFLFLIIKKYPRLRIKKDTALIVHVLSLSTLALSIVGGMDYTRLIYLGFPYLITSILLLAKPAKNELLLACILSLILSRFWIEMPVISVDIGPYNPWMPERADVPHLVYWTIAATIWGMVFFLFRKAIVKTYHS